MYRIEITPRAEKALKKIPSHIREAIKTKIDLLQYFSAQTPQVKTLTGSLRGYYRLRAGDYRIVFLVRDAVLVIVVIDVFHRGKGY